jgi:K+-transporting ATPase KdpF subunit
MPPALIFYSLPAHLRRGTLAAPHHSPEAGRGHRIHSRHSGPLCRLALDRLGDLAPRERVVTVAYIVSGVLALALCVYLLYAMFKPENF